MLMPTTSTSSCRAASAIYLRSLADTGVDHLKTGVVSDSGPPLWRPFMAVRPGLATSTRDLRSLMRNASSDRIGNGSGRNVAISKKIYRIAQGSHSEKPTEN